MKHFLILAAACGLAFIAAQTLAAEPAPAPRPNIIFILADDLGWGDLGCYGNQFLKTPHLDRLAREGVLFTDFYVNGSVCSPSRCAFFTSQYPARQRIHGHFAAPQQNQARGMTQWLDPNVPNVARLLSQAGYATAHIGKWHLGSGDNQTAPKPESYGFDFVGTGEEGVTVRRDDPHFRARSTGSFVDEALKFIRVHREQPFYVQLWTLVPHATLNPTAEQLAPFENLKAENVPHQSARSIFYASVTNLDQEIGRLLTELDAMGLADNTLVCFSSDNGPEDIFIRNAGHSGVGSPGPFRGRKRSLYEGGVRVPFLVRWPAKIPAAASRRQAPPAVTADGTRSVPATLGRVDDQSILAGVDLLPTLCKLAGATIPAEHACDGEDMSDVLLGSPRPRSRPLMWEWRFNVAGHVLNRSPMLSIREGQWKLLMNPDRSRVELYNLPADPSETDNLANGHPDLVASLSERLLAWQATLPPGPRDPNAGSNAYPWPKGSK